MTGRPQDRGGGAGRGGGRCRPWRVRTGPEGAGHRSRRGRASRRAARGLAAAIVGLGAAWGTAAAAQAMDFLGREPEETSFSITPYMFLPVTTTGTATVTGVRADVDLSGSDILDALSLAGSLRAELTHGDFALILDGYFVHLGGGTAVALPEPIGGVARADISFEQAWVAGIAAYRVLDGTIGGVEGGGAYAVDAGVGFRFNRLHQEVDGRVDLGIGPGIQRTIGGTETWVEPTVMLRGGVALGANWGVGGSAEIGGFGAGGNDLQWNLLLGAVYRPWENTALRLGWQVYGIDLATRRGGRAFGYDVIQAGPYAGATFRF